MTPTDLRSASREQLQALVEQTTWYHVIDLGDGIVTNGAVDIRPVIDHYGLPDDLRGKRALDIGRASGYFSFELERRGAEVTATELPRIIDKDYVGADMVRKAMRELAWGGNMPAADELYGDRMDFALAHLLLESRVKPVSLRLDELSPERVEGAPFDLVLVGSLIIHVSDPVGALRRILSVTGDLCILVNPIDPDNRSTTPSMRLIGRSAPGLTSWWLPNVACLEEMLYCAGFDDVTVVCPALDIPMSGSEPIPHAVLHARRPKDEAADLARWSAWFEHGLERPPAPPVCSARENELLTTIARIEADSRARLDWGRALQAEVLRLRAELAAVHVGARS